MKSFRGKEKQAKNLVRDMGRIGAQEHGGGKECRVLRPEGEGSDANDDWSSHRPDMRLGNWNCPRGIQGYYTIRRGSGP